MGGTTGGPKNLPDSPASAEPVVGDGIAAGTGLPGRGAVFSLMQETS